MAVGCTALLYVQEIDFFFKALEVRERRSLYVVKLVQWDTKQLLACSKYVLDLTQQLILQGSHGCMKRVSSHSIL